MKDEDLKEIAKRVLQLRREEIFEQEPKRCKDEELKKIAKLAISEMMTAWGIDVKNPLEMQEDFAWTRKYRKIAERVGSAILLLIALSVTGGIIGLITSSLWKETK
ncbi:hypothetical protein KAR91_42035 [Candidatus Pacearchaeota archaeon]|nr:hypothetical protein [Candidatus Pacearchaeota archaeon]